MSETQSFPEVTYIGKEWNYGQEYTQARAGEVLDVCERLGLDDEFTPILAQYITDLHLITTNKSEPENCLELRTLPHNGGREWARALVLDEADLKFRVDVLAQCLDLPVAENEPSITSGNNVLPLFKRLLLVKIEPVSDTILPDDGIETESQSEDATRNSKILTLAAIDWAFYEQIPDIIGGAYVMKNGFGKYIPDLNDQHPFYYGAQYSLSSNYLKIKRMLSSRIDLEEDRDKLKRGFGLMQLHDSLIKHGLVTHAKQAEWAIQSIRKTFAQYSDSFRGEEIADHLRLLVPVYNVLEGYQKLSESIDPTIDPDSDD